MQKQNDFCTGKREKQTGAAPTIHSAI